MAKQVGKQHLVETVFFDVLKVIAHIILPLCGTLYFTFAGALNLPSPETVVGSIAAATTALSAFIKTNEVQYNASDAKFDGAVNIIQTDAKKIYQLALNMDPGLIDQSESLLLKIVKPLPAQQQPVEWQMGPAIPPAESQSVLPNPQIQQPRG